MKFDTPAYCGPRANAIENKSVQITISITSHKMLYLEKSFQE